MDVSNHDPDFVEEIGTIESIMKSAMLLVDSTTDKALLESCEKLLRRSEKVHNSAVSLGLATPSFIASAKDVKEETKSGGISKTVDRSSHLQRYNEDLWSIQPDSPLFALQQALDDFGPRMSRAKANVTNAFTDLLLCDIYANCGFRDFNLLDQVLKNPTLKMDPVMSQFRQNSFLCDLEDLLMFVTIQTRDCPTFFRAMHKLLGKDD